MIAWWINPFLIGVCVGIVMGVAIVMLATRQPEER